MPRQHSQFGASSACCNPADVAKQIEALTKRVEQLEQQLKQHEAYEHTGHGGALRKATAPVQR